MATTAAAAVTTFQPVAYRSREEAFSTALPEVALYHQTGVGGESIVLVDGVAVQLTLTQTDLLRFLVVRMIADAHQPPQIRGYVSTEDLCSGIEWQTPYPGEAHVKQLIRRVRRSLARIGQGNLIESRRGFGYRIMATPVETPALELVPPAAG